MDIQAKYDYLNSRRVDYTTSTTFLVQVGRGKKGSYKTRYEIVGSLTQAVFYYNCINVGRGFKKRLLMPTAHRPLLARQWS